MSESDEAIPVDTPFDEYEAMRALRCACGGALSWGERDCERLAPPRARYVRDRFTLSCAACGHERPIAFLCDTGSESYTAIASSAFGVALGLGPDGAAALLAAAAGERPLGPERPVTRGESKPKPKPTSKPKAKAKTNRRAKAKPKTKKRAAPPRRRGPRHP